jgi:hypothetical protein
MRPTALLPALLLPFALLVGGCGGDDEPEPLTKDEFTTQANKICSDGNEELEAAADELGDAPTEEQIEEFVTDTVVPNVQEQHDDIADLAAPEGDEDEVEAILDALQGGIDALEEDPAGAITSGDDPLAEASELAGDYGLTECAT